MGWGKDLFSLIHDLKQETVAVLLSLIIALFTWAYSAYANRKLARRQHTINVILDGGMNRDLKDALDLVRGEVLAGECPHFTSKKDEPKRAAFRLLLNHYEFVAAAIRNGDIDERLVNHSESGFILDIYKAFSPYVENRRAERNLPSVYEHLRWLCERWNGEPPPFTAKFIEFFWGRLYWPPREKWKRDTYFFFPLAVLALLLLLIFLY